MDDHGLDCTHCGEPMMPEPFFVLTDAWIAWQCAEHGTVMQLALKDK